MACCSNVDVRRVLYAATMVGLMFLLTIPTSVSSAQSNLSGHPIVGFQGASSARRLRSMAPTTNLTASTQGSPQCLVNYTTLLRASGSVYGSVEKAGIIPLKRWFFKFTHELYTRFEAWKVRTMVVAEGSKGIRPPAAAICYIAINKAYKFAIIKTCKAAGTSIFRIFTVCPADQQAPAGRRLTCLERPDFPTAEGAAQMLKDYFIVALTRNPYSRAVSAYHYILGLRFPKNRTGSCADPTFEQYTRDPSILGRQDLLFNCHSALHDFVHVQPNYECISTEDGKLAFDYAIRYENLHEDVAELLRILNARRDPTLPEIKGELVWLQKGPKTTKDVMQTSATSASLYQQCGEQCIANVYRYYQQEIELLGYPRPPCVGSDQSSS